MATPSRAKLVITSMPTRSSAHVSDRRCAIGLSSLSQEAFDVLVVGPAKYLIRSFKNNFPIAKHEKSRVRNAEEIVLRLKVDLFVTVRGVFRRQSERVSHPVRNEDAGYALRVP